MAVSFTRNDRAFIIVTLHLEQTDDFTQFAILDRIAAWCKNRRHAEIWLGGDFNFEAPADWTESAPSHLHLSLATHFSTKMSEFGEVSCDAP
eukprot:5799356-Amphidinium_carterae.1